MNLAELIYKRFSESEALKECLAKYKGVPAIFSSEPPSEWEDEKHYPMVVYNYDMQSNQERNSIGTISVSVLCANTTGSLFPEDIEPVIRECLRDVIVRPDNSAPYCFAWSRSDAFTSDEKKEPVTIGTEIRFDILEYPSHVTSNPDPIVAINRFLKERYGEYTIIGHDELESITEITNETPAVYCRLQSISKAKETNTVTWWTGKIAVHLLCPGNSERMALAADIMQTISLAEDINMMDNSPMTIEKIEVSNKSDYLKEGQIFVSGSYGTFRYVSDTEPLNSIKLKF